MRAAVRLSALLGVRTLYVGLTVVALGSSAPQLAVALQSVRHSPDIAVGSLVGGVIFDLLVILGLSALILPLRVARQLVRVDLPLMIGAALLTFLLAWNGELGKADGVLLLVGLGLYLVTVVRQSAHGVRPFNQVHAVSRWRMPVFMRVAMMAVGLAMLVLGSHLLVGAASEIALNMGVSDRVIGLTLIAVGTSLPALAISLIAALRGERDIAVANVIGSCLFNLLGVLGLTTLMADGPLSISPNALEFDLPVVLGVAALCWPLFYSGLRITRFEGLLLLALYAVYGLHIIGFTTGMPLAIRLERLLLHYGLPVLAIPVLVGMARAWRRQH